MSAKWGNKRLEERLQEIDANTKAREEEAARPKTIDELVSLKAEEVELGSRTAQALMKGLLKQLDFVARKRAVTTADTGNGWIESSLRSTGGDKTYEIESTYELSTDASRLRVKSRSGYNGVQVVEAHFLVPEETIAKHTRNRHEYEAWLVRVASAIHNGLLRPPNARTRDAIADITLGQVEIFSDLGLIDQTSNALGGKPGHGRGCTPEEPCRICIEEVEQAAAEARASILGDLEG